MPRRATLSPSRRGPLDVLVVDDARALGVDAFVTTRSGGVSVGPYDSLNLGGHVGDDPARVRENRRRVAGAAGVAEDDLVIVDQVHGREVVEVVRARDAASAHADALVTSSSDLALAILVADCVPVLLVDPDCGRLAVAHAGWRGLVAGVLESALGHFERPEDVHALIGPAISGDRYQVGPEVAAHFDDVPDARRPDGGDRWLLDLTRVAEHRLREAGVDGEHVRACAERTDDDALFFSDRAARPCGRFALVARRHVA
ncbi:MAG: peptidoglycan editing factor PgeF [Acidimicrobiales bacterium]